MFFISNRNRKVKTIISSKFISLNIAFTLSLCYSNIQGLIIDHKMKSVGLGILAWLHLSIPRPPPNTPTAFMLVNTCAIPSPTPHAIFLSYLFKVYPVLKANINISAFFEDLSSYNKAMPFTNTCSTCLYHSLLFAFCY